MKSRFYLSTQVSTAQPLQQSSTDCLYPCDECTLKGYAHPFAFVYPSDLNLEDLSARRASSSSQFREVTWRLTLAHTRCSAFMVCLADHSFTGQGVWTAARLAQMSSRTPGGKTLLKRSIWIFHRLKQHLLQTEKNLLSHTSFRSFHAMVRTCYL